MANARTLEQPSNHPSPSITALDLRTTPAAPADHGAEKTLHEPTAGQPFVVAVGQQFGEYELLNEIARGGMGVVYRARHVNLDRVVALKMILAGRLANTEDVQRFRTEAEAAARLQHPNIVAVHDVGAHEGQHYFTMEYIAGSSLDQRLAQGPLACKAAARYVRTLARAVQYAHQQDVLHRDLKPSNILIDVADEPHITDFGLAKRLGHGNSGQTRTGAVLGTPSYMAPEQAQGKTNELGPACDIYSLGAILYELVTGRPPFRAETPLDTVMQVIENEPVPPRLLNPKIDHDLETICLKCLEKDPQARYASAEALGEDLQHYIEGDTINARSVNVIDRLARVLERDTHTADFSTWSTMVLVMAVVVGFEHIAVYFMVATGQPRLFINSARFVQFTLLGLLFWYNRRSALLPRSAAERELWTIWIGYFATYFIIIITTRILVYREVFHVNDQLLMHRYFQELLPYPFISVVSGLALFIMGSNYWGRCYALGAAFFIAAPFMALNMTLGPLIFGVLWSVALLTLGLQLRKQGSNADKQQAAKAPLSQAETVLYQEAK